MPADAQIVAFARGWDLSLVVLAAIPALVIIGAVCGIFTARLQASASRDSGGVLLKQQPANPSSVDLQQACTACTAPYCFHPPAVSLCVQLQCMQGPHEASSPSTHPPLRLCLPLCLQARASRAYGRAGAIAFEAVSHIRTVAAFGQEEGSLKGYAAALAEPTRVGSWAGRCRACWPAKWAAQPLAVAVQPAV